MSKLTCFFGLHRWRVTGYVPEYVMEMITKYVPSQQTCSRCGLKRAYKED